MIVEMKTGSTQQEIDSVVERSAGCLRFEAGTRISSSRGNMASAGASIDPSVAKHCTCILTPKKDEFLAGGIIYQAM